MFKFASNNLQGTAADNSAWMHFRPNRVCDVAKVWLQILQPWRESSDFINCVQNLDLNPKDIALFDEKGKLNTNILCVLTSTSISYSSLSSNIFKLDFEREKWCQYVREFAGFYFDIFVDYVQGVIR